jgi:UDP-N-acetylmuramate dehydrogenase
VKDNLATALLLDAQGDLQEYTLADMAYAYRTSSLKRSAAGDVASAHGGVAALKAGFGPVVLSANFRLHAAPADVVKAQADQFLAHRRRTQPVEPSLGSTFVNPPGDYAGRLIEEAGLKGQRMGGAEVSQLHANFIINPAGVGGATARDVLALIRHVQETVAVRCGVRLVPEVQLIGEWDEGDTVRA